MSNLVKIEKNIHHSQAFFFFFFYLMRPSIFDKYNIEVREYEKNAGYRNN
jgi:hypothetical protein